MLARSPYGKKEDTYRVVYRTVSTYCFRLDTRDANPNPLPANVRGSIIVLVPGTVQGTGTGLFPKLHVRAAWSFMKGAQKLQQVCEQMFQPFAFKQHTIWNYRLHLNSCKRNAKLVSASSATYQKVLINFC